MTTIRTIARSICHEIPKIKGSRFVAAAGKVSAEADIASFLSARKEEDRGATHHCFAWRLGIGSDNHRTSDDGEPSGTAGRPILQEIDGRRLTDVMVVVTRSYGGTKLGTGGLIRAYGEAAGAALDAAGVLEEPVVEVLRLLYSYEATGAVLSILRSFFLEPSNASYGAEVELVVAVPVEQVESFCEAVTDAVKGRITISSQ